jgi:hypothetical protein
VPTSGGLPSGIVLGRISCPVGKIEDKNQKCLEVHQKKEKEKNVNYLFLAAAK